MNRYGKHGGRSLCALAGLALLLLSGCRREQQDPAARAAEYYQGLSAVSVTLDVRADSGVLMDYRLAAEWDSQGCAVTVLSPEEIAGVRCLVSQQGARLAYEGAELETLLPSLPGFTPVDCLDGLLDALAGAVPTEWAWETKGDRQCLALTYEMEAGGHQAAKLVWLDRETLSPVWAEWYLEGDQIMSAGFEGFAGE